MNSRSSKWFPYSDELKLNSDTIIVFCFHHAGGSASAYKKWSDSSDTNMAFVPVELPGKGCRASEKYICDMQEIAEEAAEAIYDFADGHKFILYGHSMGSVIAFKTAYELENSYPEKPLAIVVSGRHSPSVFIQDRYTTDMDDDALVEELKIMGGTPDEILNNRNVLKIFLPFIKNDYKLNESFRYNGEVLSIPIYAYAGTDDPDAAPDMLDDWNDVTTESIVKREFNGTHFFPFDLGPVYLDTLKKRIIRRYAVKGAVG
ncbi:thioesterase II family protein [Ruminococcus flavefaciens]|uniref:thioesterase II family protein n=1 Tax=Ruminococcus flavefaciens TaxID=1265 RepID=UPI0026ECED66|nr:thioesterase domain-containing protein [Ruminococcus flavefaciens]MDD7517919.1 thioesterase domain-containing protein [Ruminococcus flavefaciens]MDY5693121.1 thioesterase domain-containing protein [Ruminococcus flavefaciens]